MDRVSPQAVACVTPRSREDEMLSMERLTKEVDMYVYTCRHVFYVHLYNIYIYIHIVIYHSICIYSYI